MINKLKIFVLASLFFSLSANALVKTWSTTLPEKSIFNTPPEMRERVNFWKRIYAEVSVDEGLFHLLHHPDVVLGSIDLKKIKSNVSLSSKQKSLAIKKAIDSEREQIALKWKIKDIKQIRLQMGLKERMQNALYVSGRYLPMMEKVFKSKELPIELTRLVFVESSFNVNAQSKVGASGLWQIMPFVAKPKGYMHDLYDKRNHPYYATLLAADILKTNYQGLKKWPLAVSAYNHGLYGVKKMVSKNNTAYLPDLIETDEITKTWGFASENFYACFLAVLEVEKEAQSFFGQNLAKSEPLKMNRAVTTKKMTQKQVLKYFQNDSEKFRKYNPHIYYSKAMNKKSLPAGLPLVLPQKIKSRSLDYAKN